MASGGNNPAVAEKWASLLGKECVIKILSPETISETIAAIIGSAEGKVNSIFKENLMALTDKAPEAPKPGAKNAGKGKTPKIGRL